MRLGEIAAKRLQYREKGHSFDYFQHEVPTFNLNLTDNEFVLMHHRRFWRHNRKENLIMPMTVAELIKELQTFPQDCVVIYEKFSEMCLLESRGIEIVRACPPRPDGWVQRKRPDTPTQTYVCFPGN